MSNEKPSPLILDAVKASASKFKETKSALEARAKELDAQRTVLDKEKEALGTSRPLVFVVLDELNKYAPREGSGPIKEVLLDVSERGRSLGIVLVGAEQTASEVEGRVVANAALRVVGRLDAIAYLATALNTGHVWGTARETVILPVLPDRTLGPYNVINPRQTWLMVVLIVGVGGQGGGAHTPAEWYDPEGRDLGLKRILLTLMLLLRDRTLAAREGGR